MTFARTRDAARIHALITAPGSWDAATDDASPPASAFIAQLDERMWYVTATDDAGVIGLFMFVPQNAVCYEIHVTRAFGARAVAAGRGVVPWFCRESGARRVVASIPITNPIAVRYAVACGFTEFGRNLRSFLKRGALVDQALLGISCR